MIFNMKVTINTCVIRGKNAFGKYVLIISGHASCLQFTCKIDWKKLKLERALNADGRLCS